MSQEELDGQRPPVPDNTTGSWGLRYGERHRFNRIKDFPFGITPPKRVRIYQRSDHFLLQWWDPAARKNVADRVDGDLVSAIARARQIEEKLELFRSGGMGIRRLTHDDLVERFLADLNRRADAGAIDPATARRYATALAHYRAYCTGNEVRKACAYAAGINRDFRLGFSAFLANLQVAPNGGPGSGTRPMKGVAFTLDVVRTMLEWAADPERGNLLPDGFRNPFLRRGEPRAVFRGDPLGEPDVSLAMVVELVRACDRFQLLLFAPTLLFGLRAAEPCHLFHEYLDADWLKVPCNLDLAYRTKGRRDKRFPLIDALRPLWDELRGSAERGLLYRRREVVEGGVAPPLKDHSLELLVAEFRRRCLAAKHATAAERLRIRNGVLRDAGGMSYDHVEHEFNRLARKLSWSPAATLKDLRHLFATTLGNAAMPEAYRRYLMGQAPGHAAIVAYTHLNQVREQYAAAVTREWTPLVEAIRGRIAELREDAREDATEPEAEGT